MERDLKSSVSVASAFDSATISSDTTTTGNIIDSQGFESLTFSILPGTITDGAYTVIIEDGEEANLSDAAVVSSELIIGSLPAFDNTESNTAKAFGTVGKKRFSRISIVSTGTSSGGVFSATVVKGHAAQRPTA